MGNKNLTYAKGAKKKFVESYFDNKFASNGQPISNAQSFVYDLANEHRTFFKPIFANETQYLPNGFGSQVISDYSQSLDTSAPTSMTTSAPVQDVKTSQSVSLPQLLTIPPTQTTDIKDDKKDKKHNDMLKFLLIGGGLFLVYQILVD
jgi:archaellin